MKNSPPERSSAGMQTLITAGLCAAVILAGEILTFLQLPSETVALLYVLGIVLVSSITTHPVYGLAATFVCTLSYLYFVKAPVFGFSESGADLLLTFVFMFLISIFISSVTSKVRQGELQARKREEVTNVFYQLSKDLAKAQTVQECVQTTLYNIGTVFETDCRMILFDEQGKPMDTFVLYENGKFNLEAPTNMARDYEKYARKPESGYFVEGNQYEWPIQGSTGIIGALGMPDTTGRNLKALDFKMISTMCEATAISIDKIYLWQKQSKAAQDVNEERFRSNLLRSISHDLRTPLAGISGTAEVLMTMLPEESEAYGLAQSIRKETRWLFDLVQNILSLTRLQNGNLKIKKELEIVEDVVDSAIETMEIRLPERKITKTMPDEILAAPMDSSLIKQVLINLIDNASKYSEQGDIEVNVWKDEATHSAAISVSDHGQGISDAALDKIFRIFYTTRAKLPDTMRGFGLGLPICDSIMKAHHGSITAGNRKDGTGAVFTIYIPLDEQSLSDEAKEAMQMN